MPIHQDPEQQLAKVYKQEESPQRHVNMRRLSEESIRTEYCDGPVPENAVDSVVIQTGGEGRDSNNGEAICSDRAELIERIKRGESPTWIPNQAVSRGWSSLWNMTPGSLGTRMVQIYKLWGFAIQRLKDHFLVSPCLLECLMNVKERNDLHVLYVQA